MSSVNKPNGLSPVNSSTGTPRPSRELPSAIPSGYASNIFIGQPIALNASGQIVPVTATNQAYIGAFGGCIYTPTGGRPAYGYWPANTVLQTGTTCDVLIWDNPTLEYEIQTDGTVTADIVGATTDFTNLAAGSTTFGYSQTTVNATPNAPGATGQFRVLGLAQYPDNNWGDPYVIVRGIIGLPMYNAALGGV